MDDVQRIANRLQSARRVAKAVAVFIVTAMAYLFVEMYHALAAMWKFLELD